jgi:hypothetical protein
MKFFTATGRASMPVQFPATSRSAPNFTLIPDAVARAGPQRLADQQLVVPHAVVVTGVEQRDAAIERGVDRGDALGFVGGSVQIGHSHAPEADRRDFEALGTERA